MKNKRIAAGLAIAIGVASSFTSAQAQLGGAPAKGDSTYGAATGDYGKDDYYNTGRQAFQKYNGAVQNYVSPQTSFPSQDEHSANQTPYVSPMVDAGRTGLNMVSTAPMATGTTTIGNTPFPSGQFNYGFNNHGVQPYHGAYQGGPSFRMGSMLPNVSTGSVDFNTVDMSGIAGAGMMSPGRGMGAPVGRPSVTMPSIPSITSTTSSVYDWLNNSFFGP